MLDNYGHGHVHTCVRVHAHVIPGSGILLLHLTVLAASLWGGRGRGAKSRDIKSVQQDIDDDISTVYGNICPSHANTTSFFYCILKFFRNFRERLCRRWKNIYIKRRN